MINEHNDDKHNMTSKRPQHTPQGSKNRVRVELHAVKLKNVAGAFKGTSDPYAIVTLLANDPREKPVILGKTEVYVYTLRTVRLCCCIIIMLVPMLTCLFRSFVCFFRIKNSLNPRWTRFFDLDYEIGRLTRINVGVYDEVRKGNHIPMGSAMFEIGEVLGSSSSGCTKAKKLRPGGLLYCRVTSAPAAVTRGRQFHLRLRGVGLKNLEGLGVFRKSDPFFEVACQRSSAAGAAAGGWYPVYRSKHVDNDLNPKWPSCSIDLDRLVESEDNLDWPILISCWDWVKNGKHLYMGSFETSVAGLIQAQASGGSGDAASVDTRKAFTLRHKGKEFGKIVVTTAKLDAASTNASPTSTSTTFSSSVEQKAVAYAGARVDDSSANYIPPFSQALHVPPPAPFAATASAETAAHALSHTSHISGNVEEPRFSPYIPGNNSSNKEPSNAAYSTTYNDPSIYTAMPLPPPMAPPRPNPTFVDYISGGCEIELAIAIDFTGSNGDPRKAGTLHYIHPDGQLNDYEKAITAVGSIIARYDYDQRFPVYGFGAKIGGVLQHCFRIGSSETVERIGGVLEAYRNVFRTGLTMSGPTVFSEVIGLAAAMARSNQESSQRLGKQSYKLLLILTDGAVSDVEQTKRSLQDASDAPLSIVIVGIGNADFSAMQFLDDFQASQGGRDICQFVEFSKYRYDKAALTRETLAEIPDQLVEYFYSRGIQPLPPVSGSQLSLHPSEADNEDWDLKIHINEEGEVSLPAYTGSSPYHYDDTKYDTIAAYVPSTSAPPPSAYKPNYSAPSPYQMHGLNAPPEAPYQPNFATSVSYLPQHSSAPSQSHSFTAAPIPQPFVPPPAAGHNHQSVQPAVSASAQRIFHVQVPPGVSAGTQLQLTNPVTKQQLIVTVPHGVAPGGRFAVQY